MAPLLGAGCINDGIAVRYCKVVLFLGAWNGTDGIKTKYYNVALFMGGGMEVME